MAAPPHLPRLFVTADDTAGCPLEAPKFVCSDLPLCTSAGARVQLGDSCWATRAGVALTYLVNGKAVASAACPQAGTPLRVQVLAQITSKPGCKFNALDAFALVSE